MRAAWRCARLEARRERGAHLAFALLVAVVGTTVLTFVAGAHRTGTAFDRFLGYSNPADAFVLIGPSDQAHLDQLAALPEVERLGVIYQMALLADTGDTMVPFAAELDDTVGTELGRPLVIQGRLPAHDAVDEVALSGVQSEVLGVDLGDTLTLPSMTPEQMEVMRSDGDPGAPDGPTVSLKVVGITRSQDDVAHTSDDPGVVILPPGFYEEYREQIGTFVGFLAAADVRPGTDIETFAADVQAVYGDTTQTQLLPTGTVDAPLRSSLRVLTAGLLVFAGVVALAGAVALALATGRQIGAKVEADAVRRDIGMTRGARVATLALPLAGTTLAGLAIAVLAAIALSGRFPVGIARQLEPDPGTTVDVAVLALAATAQLVLLIVLAVISAARLVAKAGDPVRGTLASSRSRSMASLAATIGLGPAAVTGVRMATEPGRGRRATPVRPAVLGAFVAVAGMVAALVYGASLDELVVDPHQWGWSWDVSVEPTDHAAAVLERREDDIDATADAYYFNATIGTQAVSALGLRSTKGSIEPVVVAGRPPNGPDEVVLGADTLARDGLAIGDTVVAQSSAGPRRLRIVGQGVFPNVGDTHPLADGAALTFEGAQQLDDPDDGDGVQRVVVRWSDGVDVAAANASLGGDPEAEETPSTPRLPVEVRRLTQVDRLPDLLAGFLLLLAVMAVAHASIASSKRRRADLGMLATLGFVPRQLRAVLGWQAMTIGVIGVVLGVPAGIVLGRLTWSATAAGLGVADDLVLPAVDLVAAGLGVLALLAVVGLVVGARAGRRHPAEALRAE